MSSEIHDVIDVESRVVSTQTVGDSAAAASEATPEQQVVPLEQSLVPAFDANKQIALANPAIVQLNALKEEIAAAKVDEIDVSTEEGEKKVRALLKRCVKLRTGTKAAYDAWNRPLLDAQKGIRKVVTQVEEGIAPEETKLDGIVEKIEAARKAEEERKIREEQERIAALRVKIDGLSKRLVEAVTQTSAQIEAVISELQDLSITDDPASFGEFSDEAEVLRNNTVSGLMEMFRTKRAQEEEKARLDAERERQLEEQRKAEIERALRVKIQAIQMKPMAAFGKSRAQIAELRADLSDMEPLPVVFGDLHAEALTAWQMACQQITAAHDAQKAIEEQQAEQRRIAAEQEAERKRLADAAAAAAAAAAPIPEPAANVVSEASAPAPHQEIPTFEQIQQEPDWRDEIGAAPARPLPLTNDERLDDQDPVLTLEPQELEPAPVLAMSMFASLEDYHAAVAMQRVADSWPEGCTPSHVAQSLIEAVQMSDFPDGEAGELTVVSLMLHPEVLDSLRARRAALIASIKHDNSKVTA